MSIVSFLLRRFKLNRLFLFLSKMGFKIFQSLGFHITPNHYYMPIPDTRTLTDDLWNKKSKMVGIEFNDDAQLKLLESFKENFKSEYDNFSLEKTNVPHQYYVNNRDYGSVDGEILYSMIRHFKPNLIIEIGSGHSTYLSAQAVLKNSESDGNEGKLIAIEPYPREVLADGFPGLTSFIRKKVQDVELDFFKKLSENDILFIDSSHVLKIGGDVQHEYLEILPMLNPGVIVHIHDIFLPGEYPEYWVKDMFRFWNEQYLLQAFLSFNEHFEVLFANNYIHQKYPEKFEEIFKNYNRDTVNPGSFWIRKIG